MTRQSSAYFWAHVEKGTDCWIWQGGTMGSRRGERGMPAAFLNGERLHARRIAWALTHGQVPDRILRSHCRQTWCVRPEHAYIGIGKDDMPAILAAIARGETQSAIAARYGVDRGTISRHVARATR